MKQRRQAKYLTAHSRKQAGQAYTSDKWILFSIDLILMAL